MQRRGAYNLQIMHRGGWGGGHLRAGPSPPPYARNPGITAASSPAPGRPAAAGGHLRFYHQEFRGLDQAAPLHSVLLLSDTAQQPHSATRPQNWMVSAEPYRHLQQSAPSLQVQPLHITGSEEGGNGGFAATVRSAATDKNVQLNLIGEYMIDTQCGLRVDMSAWDELQLNTCDAGLQRDTGTSCGLRADLSRWDAEQAEHHAARANGATATKRSTTLHDVAWTQLEQTCMLDENSLIMLQAARSTAEGAERASVLAERRLQRAQCGRERAAAAHLARMGEQATAAAVRAALPTQTTVEQRAAAYVRRRAATRRPATLATNTTDELEEDVRHPNFDADAEHQTPAGATDVPTMVSAAPLDPPSPESPLLTLSPALRALLMDELPCATPASAVRRFIDAHERRVARRLSPCVKKRHKTASHPSGYDVEQRHLATRFTDKIPWHLDLRNCDQLAPADVIAALELDAADSGVSAEIVGHMVLGALRRHCRPFPPIPEEGTCDMPSPIAPTYLANLVARAGFAYPTATCLQKGPDSCYFGPPRYSQCCNQTSAETEEAAPAISATLQAHVAAKEVINVTRLMRACPLLPRCVIPLAATPKSSGGWRTIHDASSNGGPNQQSAPVAYLPCAILSITEFGEKLRALKDEVGDDPIALRVYDVKSAFTNFPIRAADAFLHAFQHDSNFYVSTRQLFGMRASGFICCASTTSIALATEVDNAAAGIPSTCSSFVDDLALGAPVKNQDAAGDTLLGHMRASGLQESVLKLLPFAVKGRRWNGVAWDLELMRATMPQDKRDKTMQAALKVANAQRIRSTELASSLGYLDHAAQLIPVLGAFITEVRKCATGVPRGGWVTLTAAAKQEAALWPPIIAAHDGHYLIPRVSRALGAPRTYTDASTEWGIGFFCPEARIYLSEPYPEGVKHGLHINALEQLCSYLSIAATVESAATNATLAVKVYTDNTTSMHASNKLRSTSTQMARYTRSLAVLAARHNVLPIFSHVPGLQHEFADALSRNIVPPALLDGSWRRISIAPSLFTELLTRPDPWNTVLHFETAAPPAEQAL